MVKTRGSAVTDVDFGPKGWSRAGNGAKPATDVRDGERVSVRRRVGVMDDGVKDVCDEFGWEQVGGTVVRWAHSGLWRWVEEAAY